MRFWFFGGKDMARRVPWSEKSSSKDTAVNIARLNTIYNAVALTLMILFVLLICAVAMVPRDPRIWQRFPLASDDVVFVGLYNCNFHFMHSPEGQLDDIELIIKYAGGFVNETESDAYGLYITMDDPSSCDAELYVKDGVEIPTLFLNGLNSSRNLVSMDFSDADLVLDNPGDLVPYKKVYDFGSSHSLTLEGSIEAILERVNIGGGLFTEIDRGLIRTKWVTANNFDLVVYTGNVEILTNLNTRLIFQNPTNRTCFSGPVFPEYYNSTDVVFKEYETDGDDDLVDIFVDSVFGETVFALHPATYSVNWISTPVRTSTYIPQSQIDDLADAFDVSALNSDPFQVLLFDVNGAGVPEQPSVYHYSEQQIYLELTPEYLAFISSGLLAPKTEYFDIQLTESYCPAFMIFDEFQIEIRQKEIFNMIENALPSGANGLLAYRPFVESPFISHVIENGIDTVISYSWRYSTWLIVVSIISFVTAILVALALVFIGSKVLQKRWALELQKYIREQELIAAKRNKDKQDQKSVSEDGESEGKTKKTKGIGGVGFLQQQGLFWYLETEAKRLIAAQSLKKRGDDLLKEKDIFKASVDTKFDLKTPEKDVRKQAMAKAMAFAKARIQNTMNVVVTYSLGAVMGLPLIIAAVLMSPVSQPGVYALVGAYIFFLLINGVEYMMHILKIVKPYQVRAKVQKLSMFMAALVSFFSITVIVIFMQWIMLGLVVNPTRSLPFAAAFGTLGVHVASATRTLKDWRNQVVNTFNQVIEATTSIVPISIMNSTVQGVIDKNRGSAGGSGDKSMLSNMMKQARDAVGEASTVFSQGAFSQKIIIDLIKDLTKGLREGVSPHDIFADVVRRHISTTMAEALEDAESIQQLSDAYASIMGMFDFSEKVLKSFSAKVEKIGSLFISADFFMTFKNLTLVSPIMTKSVDVVIQAIPAGATQTFVEKCMQNFGTNAVEDLCKGSIGELLNCIQSQLELSPNLSKCFVKAIINTFGHDSVSIKDRLTVFFKEIGNLWGQSLIEDLLDDTIGMTPVGITKSMSKKYSFFDDILSHIIDKIPYNLCHDALHSILFAQCSDVVTKFIAKESPKDWPELLSDCLVEVRDYLDNLEESVLDKSTRFLKGKLESSLRKAGLDVLADALNIEISIPGSDDIMDIDEMNLGRMQDVMQVFIDRLNDTAIRSQMIFHCIEESDHIMEHPESLIDKFIEVVDTRWLYVDLVSNFCGSKSFAELLYKLESCPEILDLFSDINFGRTICQDWILSFLSDIAIKTISAVVDSPSFTADVSTKLLPLLENARSSSKTSPGLGLGLENLPVCNPEEYLEFDKVVNELVGNLRPIFEYFCVECTMWMDDGVASSYVAKFFELFPLKKPLQGPQFKTRLLWNHLVDALLPVAETSSDSGYKVGFVVLQTLYASFFLPSKKDASAYKAAKGSFEKLLLSYKKGNGFEKAKLSINTAMNIVRKYLKNLQPNMASLRAKLFTALLNYCQAAGERRKEIDASKMFTDELIPLISGRSLLKEITTECFDFFGEQNNTKLLEILGSASGDKVEN